MKRSIFAVFLLIPTILCAQQSPEPAKYALVIGNGRYTTFGVLQNAVNDANDMAAALQKLGFTVDKLLNANLDQMESAAVRLKNRLSVSRDAYGFLFYAGHGVQSNGENYLIPVDANIQSESFLRQRAVSVQTVLDELNRAGNALNIVVLDACRDFPASWSRSASRGLAVVNPPTDSIIMYATAAGRTASDGTGRNGLFTTHLLKHLATPDIEVNDLFRRTMSDVARASNNEQRPALYTDFADTAYLGQRPASNAAPAIVQAAPEPSPEKPEKPERPTREPRPVKPPREKVEGDSSRYNILGASVGTAFAAPGFIAALRYAMSPMDNFFVDAGLDFGFGSSHENAGYFSLAPYAHYNYFQPFKTGKGGWYAGLGVGYMYARYTFAESSPEYQYLAGEPESLHLFTGNIAAGVSIADMIDISYTIRTNFKSMNHRLAVGYTWRFWR